MDREDCPNNWVPVAYKGGDTEIGDTAIRLTPSRRILGGKGGGRGKDNRRIIK